LQPRTYTTVGRNVGMSLPFAQVDNALPCRQTERERERERSKPLDIFGFNIPGTHFDSVGQHSLSVQQASVNLI